MTIIRSAGRVAASYTLLTSHRRLSTALRFQPNAKLSDESILQHLVCPISKFPLRYDAKRGSLVCDEIHVEYPIWKGIPMLVPSEGRIINPSEPNSSAKQSATS
ncbi:hypothetical protein CCR75_003803 [Bremia lactucae]|uniref:Protein preY, mitochondrial n=1 Tax=Bremia lactucae TaxID=4779 RepID=A0A976IDZ1_BRELC|nr:hypothetical protein CCR75_003803 [Bremia lactucae]